jgi:hypothetical protein
LKISDWQSAGSNRPNQQQKWKEKGFDKAVIRLSNCTLVFVYNKSAYPRVGFAALSLTFWKIQIPTAV